MNTTNTPLLLHTQQYLLALNNRYAEDSRNFPCPDFRFYRGFTGLAGAMCTLTSALENGQELPLTELLGSHCVFLTGRPGEGKTAALRFIATRCVSHSLSNEYLPGMDNRLLVPVYIHAKSIENFIDPLCCYLARRISAFLPHCGEDDILQLLRWWERTQSLVLLVDGLDEAGSPERVTEKLQYFLNVFQGVTTIVAGRPHVSRYFYCPGRDKTICTPVIDCLVQQNLFRQLVFAKQKSEDLKEEARVNDILDRLRASPVAEMLGNLLFLNIVATRVRYGEDLSPDSLCDEWIEVMWRRGVERGLPASQRTECLRAIEELAWYFQEYGSGWENDIAIALGKAGFSSPFGTIHSLHQQMGVLTRTDLWLYTTTKSLYEFAYPSLQERYVALRLKNEDSKRVFAFLRPRMYLPEWQRPLAFLVCSLSPQEQIRFLTSLLVHRTSKDILHRDLLLLARLIKASGVSETLLAFRTVFLSALRRHRGELPREIIEVAIQAGKEDAICLLVDLLRHHQGNRKEIVLSLGKTSDSAAISALIDILYDDADEARYAAMIALSNIGRQAVDAIIKTPFKDLSQDALWRAVKTVELAGFYDEYVRYYLIDAIKWEGKAQFAACEALARFRDDKTLIEALSVEHARFAVVLALERLGTLPLPGLLYFLKEFPEYRSATIEAIGRCGDKSVASTLIEFLHDPDASVRESAAMAIGRIRASEATDSLIALLKDENIGVRKAAIHALGEIGSVDAVPYLIEIVEKAETNGLRISAVTALGKIRDSRAVPALMSALQSPDENIQVVAAESLGKIGDPQSIPALLSALTSIKLCYPVARAMTEIPESIPYLMQILGEESNICHRYMAIAALGMMGVKQAIPYLRDALTDNNDILRSLSVVALGQIGGDAVQVLSDFLQTRPAIDWLVVDVLSNHISDERAKKTLIEAANRGSHIARIRAISTLRKARVKDREAIKALIIAATAENDEIRCCVAQALAEVGDLTVIPTLVSMLRDQSNVVRKQAVRALAKILSRICWTRTMFGLPPEVNTSNLVCMTDAKEIRQLKKATLELKKASLNAGDYDALRVALETECRITIISSVLRTRAERLL